MPALQPAPVSTRQFTYDALTRTFTAEVSETTGFGQVWDDAADLGLTLISHRTGKPQVFVIVDEKRDADGDVTEWTLRSITGRTIDGHYAVVLFND